MAREERERVVIRGQAAVSSSPLSQLVARDALLQLLLQAHPCKVAQ